MNVLELIQQKKEPQLAEVQAFAPANIALCKYWGKRDSKWNLPVTSSLSLSLGDKGAITSLAVNNLDRDRILLAVADNNQHINLEFNELTKENKFYQRLVNFLDLFRPKGMYFTVNTQSNLPISAGLASSAAGFAAIVKALDQLFAWQLTTTQLSILARLGSGSACRSLWPGFVIWHAGIKPDGSDSHGELLPMVWPELRWGLLIFTTTEKKISSRQAMQISVDTCPYYQLWPEQVNKTLAALIKAIKERNLVNLGIAMESNALQMHALMQTSVPAIIYSNGQTLAAMEKVWQLRQEGIAVYFTQDAGPNLKLLFLAHQKKEILAMFPEILMVDPWQ